MQLLGKARDFSLLEARVARDPQASSSRDFRLELQLPGYRSWEPGQFVMLRWGRHVVGRPFAIVDWKRQGSGSRLSVWIRRLGAGTEEISRELRKDDPVWVTLPLGQGLKGALKGAKKILFLSGGVGAASILPLTALTSRGTWVHGERDVPALDAALRKGPRKARPTYLYFEELAKGRGKIPGAAVAAGRITQALELPQLRDEGFTHAVACGPSPMLEALAQRFAQDPAWKNVKLWLGLEEKMACGIGLCFSCSVSTQDGMQRCCLEGPWFEAGFLRDHFAFRKGGA